MIDHPSSVHNKVTSAIPPKFSTYGEWRRQSMVEEWEASHAAYAYLDNEILRMCDRTGNPAPRAKSELLESCRQNAWFTRHIPTGEIRVASNACHLRWCPVCAEARKNFIGHEVAGWIKDLKYPKLLTFTLKHDDRDLLSQVQDLYRYFHQLRDRKEFREIVVGGIWFFQIKLSRSSKQWHPHIHCIVDGQYMPKSLLRRLWVEITDVSMIVDIRSVKDPDGCAQEVARYAAKPGPLKGLDILHAVELVTVMHGRRICGTWGIGRKISLRPKKFADKDDWLSVGSWSRIMTNRKTDPICEQIFHAWQNHEPLAKDISCYAQECRDKGEHVLILTDSTVLEDIYSESWVPP